MVPAWARKDLPIQIQKHGCGWEVWFRRVRFATDTLTGRQTSTNGWELATSGKSPNILYVVYIIRVGLGGASTFLLGGFCMQMQTTKGDVFVACKRR